MLIVCPNCATSYQIEPGLVGAPERPVRCARCLSVWTMDTRAAVPAIVRTEDSEILAQGPLIPPQERHINAGTGSPRGYPPLAAGDGEIKTPAAGADDALTATHARMALDATTDEASGLSPHAASAFSEMKTAHDLEAAQAEVAHVDQNADLGDAAAGETLAPFIDTGALSIVPQQGPDESAAFSARRSLMSRVKRKRVRRHSAAPNGGRRKKIILASAGLALLAACNVALVGWRGAIVRQLPQTAPLYAAIGLPVNLRGLAFTGLHTAYETLDGVGVLLVQGAIVSKSTKPVAVPHIRLAVRNAAHQEIYAWTTKPEHALLRPQERLAFKARLASPPQDARDVVVRFLNSRDLSGRSL